MHEGKIKEREEALPPYSFREGDYLLTLTKEGVRFKGEDEFTLPYSQVRFCRAIARKRIDDLGREKLYFTAPFPSLSSYNRYCYKEKGKCYRTHEFRLEERAEIERAIEEFSIPVEDKRVSVGLIKPPLKTFREDGGIAHRIYAIALFVFVAFIIGAVIMYLINYFLHTDTELLALVFGIFCLPCLAVVVIKSQELGSKVKVYDKGVYLKIRSKSGYGGTNSPFAVETAFLSWDEIECVEHVQSQVDYRVVFRLRYCTLSLPDFNGIYDYIAAHFPEACKVEK